MGAIRRAGPRERQLSRAANCSGSFVARGVCRVASKSFLWRHILVKSAGAYRARGRLGANARLAVAKRAMERCLHLQGRSEEHTSELQSLTNLVCRLLLEKK